MCRLLIGGDGAGIDLAGVDIHADARFHEVHDDKADHQRQRREDFEIDQRPHADLADFLDIAHLGDAEHDGGEDHRCQKHLDELDEAVCERLQCCRDLRCDQRQRDADRNADQDLNV